MNLENIIVDDKSQSQKRVYEPIPVRCIELRSEDRQKLVV